MNPMARKPRLTQEERLAADLLARALSTRNGRITLCVLLLTSALAVGAYYLYQQHHHPQSTAAAPPATQSTTATGTIRIATWNLMKFSERDRPNQHPPDLVAIANIIKAEHFDLIAIQEVQQTGQMAQKLRRQLNEPWRLEITDQTGLSLKERYAFLYRADRVELTAPPRLLPAPDAEQFDRVPAQASFRAGNFDCTLITTHLWYGSKPNNPQRRQEAAALARYAKSLADTGPEHDIIILGDFNEPHANGNMPLFESAGFTPLNRDPTNLAGNETYDNILINPQYTREFTGVAGATPFDQTLYNNDDTAAKQSVSDHRPVHADFTTAAPDDD
jgi:endonuclease/exonuclease/phosphatase family metal-dependent hydrolase